MGEFLSVPNKEKVSEDKDDGNVSNKIKHFLLFIYF